MNFEHTQDRRMLAGSLNRYISEQYGFTTRNTIAQSPTGFSRELWERFAELGIIGALFDPAQGGYGGAGFDVAVVFECLGRGLVLEPFLGALLVGQAIATAGSAAQRPILEHLIEGRYTTALAHEEPGGHYEPARVATSAHRDTDGWVLNGAKAVVDQGEDADFFLVSARSHGAIHEEHGISLFLVARNTAGLQLRGYRKTDGGRACDITLDHVSLPDQALLGPVDGGFEILEHCVGYGVLALCAEAVGAMDVARDATLEYLRVRKQFGVPIGSFQALQHRMADLLLNIEQARSALINAAASLGSERVTRERALSAAKYSIGQIGTLVAEECIQLHGAIGMTWELPLAHYAKRLVMIEHQLGDADHHLARYIALGRLQSATG